MLELHPNILEKNGRKEFVVLPYEEFVALQERLEDVEDLLELSRAQEESKDEPTLSLDEVKQRLGL